jgi:multiple sugar transport system substrate-binding protein
MVGTSAGLTYILAGAKPGVAIGESTLPAGPKHQYTEMFGAPMIMFKGASAAQKDAGWTFLKWLTEAAQTAYWSENTGYMPVRQSALKMGTMRSYYSHNPQQRAAVLQLNHALVEPSLAGWTKAQSDLRTTLLAALSGSQAVMQAVKAAASQVNADLSS